MEFTIHTLEWFQKNAILIPSGFTMPEERTIFYKDFFHIAGKTFDTYKIDNGYDVLVIDWWMIEEDDVVIDFCDINGIDINSPVGERISEFNRYLKHKNNGK
jgi:hypothetical protein